MASIKKESEAVIMPKLYKDCTQRIDELPEMNLDSLDKEEEEKFFLDSSPTDQVPESPLRPIRQKKSNNVKVGQNK